MGKIWLIRHGLTEFNRLLREYDAAGRNSEALRVDLQYCDCELNETGIAQLETLVQQVHALDIDTVFVSPLRRTLHTCKILFEHHPSSPRIVVSPLLHEGLTTVHDISLYSGEPFKGYEHFDWSQVPADGVHLARHVLDNNYTRQLETLSYSDAQQRLAQLMGAAYPGLVETHEEVFQRAQQALSLWQSFQPNIALVGHSNFFRKTLGYRDESGQIVEPHYIKNGEMFEFQ